MLIPSFFFVYCLTTAALVIIKYFVCRLFHDEQRRNICNEFLCSTLWCIWCLELRIMRDYYLIQTLTMYVFMCIKQFFCRGGFTNPCGVLAEQMSKTKPMTQSVLLLAAEMLGTICALLYSFGLCALLTTYDLSQDHANFYSQEHHVTPLNVSPAWGFIVELGFTFVSCSMDAVFDPPFDAIFSSTVYITLYFVLGHLTGAYINPLTSLASTAGREGEDILALILVYLLGPLVGTAMAMRLLPAKNIE